MIYELINSHTCSPCLAGSTGNRVCRLKGKGKISGAFYHMHERPPLMISDWRMRVTQQARVRPRAWVLCPRCIWAKLNDPVSFRGILKQTGAQAFVGVLGFSKGSLCPSLHLGQVERSGKFARHILKHIDWRPRTQFWQDFYGSLLYTQW